MQLFILFIVSVGQTAELQRYYLMWIIKYHVRTRNNKSK